MSRREFLRPEQIEERSFQIISSELSEMGIAPEPPADKIIRRVIHATADFDFARILRFLPSPAIIEEIAGRIRSEGAAIVTDTNMALAGIRGTALRNPKVSVNCFMADEDVAQAALEAGSTRAAESMAKAARTFSAETRPLLLAVGNAPTALFAALDKAREGRLRPALVIGAPVGFVNVEAAKEALAESGLPCVISWGRKGGSPVAAAIVNAILRMAAE